MELQRIDCLCLSSCTRSDNTKLHSLPIYLAPNAMHASRPWYLWIVPVSAQTLKELYESVKNTIKNIHRACHCRLQSSQMHDEQNSCWDMFVVRGFLCNTANYQLPLCA